MIGYVILGVVVLILVILLLTPIRIRIRYQDGETSVKLSAGPIKKSLYPGEDKQEETEYTEKKPEDKPGKKKTGNKKPKKKHSVNSEQILYFLEKGPSILGRALKRLGHRVRIKPLKLHLLVATTDPADTAVLYGRIQAALGAILPELHRCIHIDDQDIRLFPDFVEEKMDVIADIGVALRPWDILVIGVCAGCSLVKLLVGFKRRGDREEVNRQNTPAQRMPDVGQKLSDVSANSNDEEKK